jgi:hypothetical protein
MAKTGRGVFATAFCSAEILGFSGPNFLAAVIGVICGLFLISVLGIEAAES